MTLLDRFRTQPGQHHPDAAVRLAYVEEIPLDAREVIAAIAREDDDPRVRRAAVGKLLAPAVLATIAEHDGDEGVREQATAMLRDIALEVFEGLGESESLEAVDLLSDQRTLGQIAKRAVRPSVALRALSRIADAGTLGSIARRALSEAARQGAFSTLRERNEREEILGVAMNAEYKDTAVGAVDSLVDRADLEAIEVRGRNKAAVKRARALMRDADEQAEREAAEAAAPAAQVVPKLDEPSDALVAAPAELAPDTPPEAAESAALETLHGSEPAEGADSAPQAPAQEGGHPDPGSPHDHQFADLCDAAAVAVGETDLGVARKALGRVRREWRDLSRTVAIPPALQLRLDQALARLAARDAEASDAEVRARRDALNRLHQLLSRVEALVAKSDFTLKAGERAARDLRLALESIPPLPSREDFEDVSQRLTAAQSALMPRVLELREAAEWQRFANAGIQEQLCAKMEALREVEDPDQITREVRELQQTWRQAADVPRAQAEVLWHRFKAAHDQVWSHVEALFATQAEIRAANLQKKLGLCDRAEALTDSTDWIRTAEELKALQVEWKSIGPVTRGSEKATWDRFRSACDRFFRRRQEDLVARKKTWAENLSKKEALCDRAETLADSTDWEAAAAELKTLQNEWRAIGPVKKSRSEAVWQRFRSACDRFFERFAARHDTARIERVAAREAICAELEALAGADQADAPSDLVPRVRDTRGRWQQSVASRGVDAGHARVLDARFTAALSALLARWPGSFAGTDLDPDANYRRGEKLVARLEELAESLAEGATRAAGDASVSPTTRLAAMLKEALAANTIGGRPDDAGRLRSAVEEVRQAQGAWARLGPMATVPDEARRSLAERFQRACQRIAARAGATADAFPRPGQGGATGRWERPRRPTGPGRTERQDR